MQSCEFHPERLAVGRCRDCGSQFCVRCAEETGQAVLCKRCFGQSRLKEGTGIERGGVAPAQAAPAAGEMGGGEAFLAQGPDYDFSQLRGEGKRLAQPARGGAGGAGIAEAKGPTDPSREHADAAAQDEGAAGAGPASLDDVLASLATPSGTAAAATPVGERAATGEIPLQQTARERLAELAEQRRREKEARRRERAERWSFLGQPRSEEATFIAATKIRAVLVVLGFWFMAVLLWSVPNAFLPFWPFAQDSESLLWAQVVGIAVGLCFWRKAGRSHGTKLAVQAALVTLFGIIAGEFFHWFLMVYKEVAFRTIINQLVTFEFIKQNGALIFNKVSEAIFSRGFILLVAAPTVLAFIIGFGMPPIPEFLFEFWGALTGKKKAGITKGAEGRPGA